MFCHNLSLSVFYGKNFYICIFVMYPINLIEILLHVCGICTSLSGELGRDRLTSAMDSIK